MKLNAEIHLFSRVRFLDVLLFTKHLAVMIRSSIMVAEALETLAAAARSARFRRVLSLVLADVRNGLSLADALRKHPKVFDEMYVSLISIGEASGTLRENLEFLALQLAKERSIRQKIRAAMLYPAIVFAATTIMGGSISLFVLPRLVDFFAAFEVELPLMTRILLFVANLMKNYGIFIVAGAVLAFVLFLLTVRSRPVKPLWHRFLLHFPIVGPFLTNVQLARFTRNFGTLLQSAVPAVRGLEVTAGTLSNLTFRADLLAVSEMLAQGTSIADALSDERFQEFPPLVSKMILVGERTGRLPETLLYLGDFYEEEIDTFTKNLTTILEPLLLLGIGLVVGFVALAIISPIYELTGSIRR